LPVTARGCAATCSSRPRRRRPRRKLRNSHDIDGPYAAAHAAAAYAAVFLRASRAARDDACMSAVGHIVS
jgi:hypothetical protein